MSKTILVLLDACRYDTATENAGYLEHLVEVGLAAKYRVRGELPSISRPMYETVMTGLPCSVHGIVSNRVVRPSTCNNLFSLCRQNGLITAAAAFRWISELYSKPGAFDPADRYQLEGTGGICHGIYYYDDLYPDSHLFDDGEFLRRRYQPDFLLLHPMNIDYWGHKCGGDSFEYTQAVWTAMDQLAGLLPGWLAEGWQVVVTADHGMDGLGLHGGPTEQQRTVPLYIVGAPAIQPGRYEQPELSQLAVAPLVCRLLGLPPATGMLQKLPIALLS